MDEKRLNRIESRIGKVEDRCDQLDDRMSELEGTADEGPTLKQMLSLWQPGGLKGLAKRCGYAPSLLTRFIHARGPNFPVVLAAKVTDAFRRRGINPFGEPMTLDRLRVIWTQARKRAAHDGSEKAC